MLSARSFFSDLFSLRGDNNDDDDRRKCKLVSLFEFGYSVLFFLCCLAFLLSGWMDWIGFFLPLQVFAWLFAQFSWSLYYHKSWLENFEIKHTIFIYRRAFSPSLSPAWSLIHTVRLYSCYDIDMEIKVRTKCVWACTNSNYLIATKMAWIFPHQPNVFYCYCRDDSEAVKRNYWLLWIVSFGRASERKREAKRWFGPYQNTQINIVQHYRRCQLD